MGQRRREREGGRFSPAAVSHPFLLQIVYPSRGGPSTRRILYYRLEYLTRQGDTSPPRDRKRSFSSFLFHPPPARCTTAAPNSFRFSSTEGKGIFSLPFSSLPLGEKSLTIRPLIYLRVTSFTPRARGCEHC